MSNIMMRLLTVIMLMIFSMGAYADVKVLYGEEGTEKFEGTGGTIEVKQEDSKDDKTKVTVTLIVTPSDGYTLARDNSLEAYAVISPDGASTRAPEISGDALNLDCDDFKDISEKRTYTTTIDSKLALWIKKAEFQSSGKKEPTRETSYSGVYYIASGGNTKESGGYTYSSTPANNFYLVPTCGPAAAANKSDVFHDNTGEQEPFLTTYKIGEDNEAAWVLQQVTDDDGTFYYVIHVKTNKYVVYDPYYSDYPNNPSGSGNWRRKCMHLQASSDENAKFVIGERNDAYYFIPKVFKDVTPGKGKPYIFWNIADGNKNNRQGQGASDYWNGLVGLYGLDNNKDELDPNSKWKFETAHLTAPTISDVSATNTITITDANELPSGYTIRYTTGDGTQDAPTATTGTEYSGPIEVTSSMTVKAVVVRYGIVLTEVASKAIVPVIAAPTVTNNFDGTISLNTTTTGTTIYYTTNGDTPDNNSTPYNNTPFSLGNATIIKTIAYLGSESSEVTTYNVPKYTTPTISFNSSTSQATITSDGSVYYNTGDGSQTDPTTSSTAYSAPFTVSSATTVKAIATHAGYLTSDMATLAITQVATPTIQNNGSNAISITSATEGATIYYTTDGTTPNTSSTEYTGPLTEYVSNVTINAIAVKENMITSAVGSGLVKLQCATPVITREGMTFSVSCSMPTNATFYYSLDGSTPETLYSEPVSFTSGQLPMTVKAVAKHANYTDSDYATFELLNGQGTSSDPYLIYGATDFTNFINNVNNGTTSSSCYKLETDISARGMSAITTAFSGTFDGNFHTISNLEHALFSTIDGGIVKNVILNEVGISSGTNVGAICNEATGDSRIYNCGVLGTLTETKDEHGTVTNIASTSTISGSGYVGSIVGLLDGTSRVINCYSFATVSGGTMAAGIVGNNNQASTQSDLKTIVVNCMFYGDITDGSAKYPVYGGNSIDNDANNGINPYCYFRKNAPFTPTGYNRSWPAEEKNLTRFEYYRSILNSNRKLCTWWVNGIVGTAPTEDDVKNVGIAKWVLDPVIAPYPILKPWGKYPSVINIDPEYRFKHTINSVTNIDEVSREDRSSAEEWKGKSYNTLTVYVYPGSHNSSASSVTKNITITDMDLDNCDYGYYKIQLPYYNEVFGNPQGITHAAKYGNNYTDEVVTGWNVTEVNGSTEGTGSFTENWETGYNFADRSSTKKDLFGVSGRVFAQGGYYYVPVGVSNIKIVAHWGKAVYLANRGYSIDRVKVTAGDYRKEDGSESKNFAPAGTVSETFQTYTVYNDLQNAIKALGESSSYPTVYDQAIVLIGNHQVKNGSNAVGYGLDSKWHPFTIMSVDFDFDNEPDYCLQLQFRSSIDRPGIQPIRFDFLPVVELGLAVRHNNFAYAIGIFVPQGHFEITETAFMHTTQFEWDGADGGNKRMDGICPVILNGGEFEQITVRKAKGNRTDYFLLGGKAWIHRFAPGSHPNKDSQYDSRLCAVNAIGGEYPEFYLSGLYRSDLKPGNGQGNPHCYVNGGKFGTMAGAGYEKVNGNVTFKINHADIEEFYGGGINGSNAIGGNIDVTIDYSRVTKKYCGGPMVGDMTGRTVTTHATGTTFEVFYGGGNGGNSYYRQMQDDGDWPAPDGGGEIGLSFWNNRTYNWNGFTPLTTTFDDGKGTDTDDPNKKRRENKGYHAEYEFEVFNQSNGVANQITQRGFIKWIQFGITVTGDVENTLTDCTINKDFYGGGNLATVDGTVTSTLTNTTVIGNVFGAGFSGEIPTFQVQDKESKTFPSIDAAGTLTDGNIDPDSKVYEWTNDLNEMLEADRKASPTYSKTEDGVTKWYCYTWNSLENLGVVTGDVELNINGNTLVKGMTDIGEATEAQTGGVFGGGDASSVGGNTTVIINATGQKDGYGYNTFNVFGGGNAAAVGGDSSVTLKGKTKVGHDVFGGGNMGVVTGSATVNIE